MTATTASAIQEHLQNLCQAIADDEEVQAARAKAEAFLADDDAVALYREVAESSHNLEKRHRAGAPIGNDEIQAFEELQAKADGHDAIQDFQEAQGTLQRIATLVNSYVTKTLEKGRVPAEEEISSGGCCGGGCGCN